MNRRKCEDDAREQRLLPADTSGLRTIEDTVVTRADGYDARIWVALEPPSKPGAPLVGHVFEFAALVRRCVFFHFDSSVPSDDQEDVLSDRMAVARLKILRGFALEPFDEVRREKPRPAR